MKANKFFMGIATLAVSTLVLGACASDDADKESNESNESSTSTAASKTSDTESSAEAVSGASLQDGTYSLKELNDKNGYHAVFSITAKEGKITESKFDYLDKDGKSKTEDADYNKNMKDKSGVAPEEYIPQLNEALEKEQNPANVEVVTGATHSSNSFQNYAQQLVQAAQAGNSEEIEIDNGAKLQDGTYTLEEKNYSNGYRTVFSIVVEDGKVAESNFDSVNKDGKSKTEDADYEKNMKDKSGVGPKEYTKTLNEDLVKVMNGDEDEASPADVDVVTGATHSSHTFILYAEQLINAAEKGDTDKIEVDNFVEE